MHVTGTAICIKLSNPMKRPDSDSDKGFQLIPCIIMRKRAATARIFTIVPASCIWVREDTIIAVIKPAVKRMLPGIIGSIIIRIAHSMAIVICVRG